jgi:hypothetical protein
MKQGMYTTFWRRKYRYVLSGKIKWILLLVVGLSVQKLRFSLRTVTMWSAATLSSTGGSACSEAFRVPLHILYRLLSPSKPGNVQQIKGAISGILKI